MRLSGHISTDYKQTLEDSCVSFYSFSQLDDWQCTSLARLISPTSTFTPFEPRNTFTQITTGFPIIFSHTWGSRVDSVQEFEVSGKKGKTISAHVFKSQRVNCDTVDKCEGLLGSRIFPNTQVSTNTSLYLCPGGQDK